MSKYYFDSEYAPSLSTIGGRAFVFQRGRSAVQDGLMHNVRTYVWLRKPRILEEEKLIEAQLLASSSFSNQVE